MKKAFPILLLLVSLSTAMAQSDFGIWSTVNVSKSWEKSYGYFLGELRTCDNSTKCDCFYTGVGWGYKFTKWLKSDISYEFWDYPGSQSKHKIVLHLHESIKSGDLAVLFREKYELVINPSGSLENNLRLRFRAQYSLKRFVPYIMYEIFFGFEGRGWTQSRHYLGTDFKFSKNHSASIFYMYQLFPSKDSNILGLGYTFSF